MLCFCPQGSLHFPSVLVHSSYFNFIAISFKKLLLSLPTIHFSLFVSFFLILVAVIMPFPSKITFCVLVSPLEYKLSSVWERCVIVIAEFPSPNSVLHTVGKHVCGINKNPRGQGAWLDLIPAPNYSLFPLFYFIYLSREKRESR